MLNFRSDLIAFYLATENWRWRGQLPLAAGATANIIDDGVIELLPAQLSSQLDLVLSVAVHGNETAPIEMVSQLFEQLTSGALRLQTRTLLLFCNLQAMQQGVRFCEENMNRLFSGNHQQIQPAGWESSRAQRLEAAVRDFFAQSQFGQQRVHYDLHTAIRGSCHERFAVAPYRAGQPLDPLQTQWLAAAGIEAIVQYHEPTTTFSYFSASQCDAQAFTLELGKAKPFGENNLQEFAACQAMLAGLLSGELPQQIQRTPHIYRVARVINRTQADFQFSFADDLPNFSTFQRGELLAKDGEQAVYAEQDGEVVIFPNAKVQMGHRAALIAVPIAGAG